MIKVHGCRILVRPIKIHENDEVFKRARTAGIQLLEMSERKEQVAVEKGTVLEMGKHCNKDYVGDLKVGDVIGFAKFGGKFITDPDNDEMLLVINDEDVVCTIKETK